MLKDIAPKGRTASVHNARLLRSDMSLFEVILWRVLRARPRGLKFRRQHASGPYVLDFYCSDARLAIEIDDEAHSRGDEPERDRARDDWLLRKGVATLRIPATNVLANANAVTQHSVHAAVTRLPLHHPTKPDGPPPRDKLGENDLRTRRNSAMAGL